LPLPDKPSLAVLPFTNMSGDPEQEYFSDGITDDLITDISKISGLSVKARNSVFTYKGKAIKVEEIRRELEVRYILEGSVRRIGDRLRINVQLVDATTDTHLWADRYDREWKDIFALQDEIRTQIILALKVRLTPEEHERFRHAPTDNLEAYDLYLRGLATYGRFTQEGNAQARQLFERAIALDPEYAGAYTYLGWTYWIDWNWEWSSRPQALERAVAAAQRAVALNDSLAGAHALLGAVYLLKGQYEEGIAEMERAIALDPNSAEAYVPLAEPLDFVKRPEAARESSGRGDASQSSVSRPLPIRLRQSLSHNRTVSEGDCSAGESSPPEPASSVFPC
jgi:adenylate cyclase